METDGDYFFYKKLFIMFIFFLNELTSIYYVFVGHKLKFKKYKREEGDE